MSGNSDFLSISIDIAYVLLSLAGVATMWRLVRGPTLHDRIVALDVLSAIVVGLIGVIAIEAGESALVDVSLIVALVTFLGTVAFSIFLEVQKRHD
ncbi:MAG: pH regulation protein F [Chloroflexi bacterium]|nr:pH regulation protein F [Chloroflexota bacterium]